MSEEPIIERDELFLTGDTDRIWQKYCGFLELSIDEFMKIQERLLMEQIELVADSELGRKIMNGNRPTSVEEFRRMVPLTTYEDYEPYLSEKREDALAEKPVCWVHTSGRSGTFKWVPYTGRFYDRLINYAVAGLILSCARCKGEVNVKEGDKVFQNTPPPPYMTGTLSMDVPRRIPVCPIPPVEYSSQMGFQEKIEAGFKMGLRSGVDHISSMTSIMVKMGRDFADGSMGLRFSPFMLHPAVLSRLLRAWLRCKIEKRPLLPRDLWPVKGVTCWGMDTATYRKDIIHYWGRLPYEYYGCTEGGIPAVQGWGGTEELTFTPSSVFLEFIPEEEWLKNKENREYQPSTVLLNEVEAGKCYEVVITNFYGMPFLRYCLGDLIKVVSMRNDRIGIRLPQIIFQSRVDGIIDIAGFTRLDEKTIWQAIANTGIKYEDWAICKEEELDKPILRLYIELKEERDAAGVEQLVHEQLKALDSDYRNLEDMIGLHPLRVTILSRGTNQRYLEEKQAAGFDLAHLKPAHINAPDSAIQDLLRLSQSIQEHSL